MCLESLTAVHEPPLEEERIAYKVGHIDPGARPYFVTQYDSMWYALHETCIAGVSKSDLIDGSLNAEKTHIQVGSRQYPIGFHCYVNIENARYAKRYARYGAVIMRVRINKICAEGRNLDGANVVVAKEIVFDEVVD